jgi:hypothetical protein
MIFSVSFAPSKTRSGPGPRYGRGWDQSGKKVRNPYARERERQRQGAGMREKDRKRQRDRERQKKRKRQRITVLTKQHTENCDGAVEQRYYCKHIRGINHQSWH